MSSDENRIDASIDRVICGDSLSVLKTLPDNSVDSIVSDPPAGIFFMNKTFDHNKGGREHWIAWLSAIMREALRVLKPGGHALVWSLPRTSHWTGIALEDAGFQMRDCLYHVYSPDSKITAFYASLSQEQANLFEQVLDSQDVPASVLACFGTGFPKSANVSLMIDKHFNADREIVGPSIRLGDKKAYPHNPNEDSEWNRRYDLKTWRDPVTRSSTDEARQHEGKGTALKPAVENWWLCRKPLAEKTIAEQVLKNGCGAINIDASRIETNDRWHGTGLQSAKGFALCGGVAGTLNRSISSTHTQGRFPAHLLLSHTLFCIEQSDGYVCQDNCPVRLMDEQSGMSKSNPHARHNNPHIPNVYNFNNPRTTSGRNDQGGASRYFKTFPPLIYTSKASTAERNKGCDSLATSPVPRYGAGIGEGFDPESPVFEKNHHPTVKPLALLNYFSRLLTPENGIILDMFAGSGSTAVSAIHCGFHYILIDMEAEYCAIANARIAQARRDMEAQK